MKEFDKKDFFKNGFYIIKNLLEKEEIEKYKNCIKKKRDSLLEQNAATINADGSFKIKTSDTQKFKEYSEYDDKNLWDYVSNEKLIDNISELLNEKAYFVHDLGLLDPSANPNNDCTWHRDSPCRTIGVGPDWDQNIRYNVVTAITYLRSSNECGTGLSVIPGSHKLSYKKKLSNILRYTHSKTRNNKYLKTYRNLISNLVGKTINYEAGDCLVFLTTLLHTPVLIDSKKTSIFRQCITSRYGGIGKHSNTYIDYVTNKRKEMNKYINSKKKDEFINHIKKKKIFLPFVEKINATEGIFIKK